jgi:hypothetical protein
MKMKRINKIKAIEFLSKLDFQVEKSELFIEFDDEIAYLFNPKNNISLIIKQYKKFDEKEIMNDVIKARLLLRELDINIWNTYYLILLDENDFSKKWYNIEKNSKGIRKYLIFSEDDFLRIPFLERKPTEILGDLVFDNNLSEILSSENDAVNKLIRWILDDEGEFSVINHNKLKEKVRQIFIGEENEHRKNNFI